MISRFITNRLKYDGTQINSLWTYRHTGLVGDSIVSFIGPCNIPARNIVDIEDLQGNNKIASPLMLHFIIEHFEMDLTKAILRQRLLVAIIKDLLEQETERRLTRRGDDIFDDDRKLSISVATLTPVSAKIHFAINIESKGTPVKTKGLKDYGIKPEPFARRVLNGYVREISDLEKARGKVRGVE